MEKRRQDLQTLVHEYQTILKDVIKKEDAFDITRLPKHIQDSVQLVTAKAPAFSNIAALTTVNYVYAHVVAQLRARINDPSYSTDVLGVNYYGVLLSSSGTGKSSSYNAVMSVCKTGLDLIEEARQEDINDKARALAYKELLKDNENAILADIGFSDYCDYVVPMAATVASPDSTRGGLSTLLQTLNQERFGALSLFFDEFGLDLKNGSTVQEVLQMLGQLFDSGMSQAPAYKTAELKETALVDAYVNMLGHTSPKLLFADEKIKQTLSMLFHTMLARRAFFSFPDEDEATENNPVPGSASEERSMLNERKLQVSKHSATLDNRIAESVRVMLLTPNNCAVSFTEDAAHLYEDYKSYCSKQAELLIDQEILQIELYGRAFKVARVAAIWQLTQGGNEISYEMLASAIYFAEYNSKYLEKFIRLTTSKPFILLGDVFKSGKTTEITLDSAIQQGYLYRISNDFKELLDPMNSYLRKVGVCKYVEETKTFIYTPFQIIEQEEVVADERFALSYTKTPGIAKDDRKPFLDNFKIYKDNGSFKFLENILQADTVYNPFRYKDAPDKDGNMVTMNRNQKNIEGSTNLIIIDVDKSEISIDVIHDYLSEYQHIVATTSDKENKYKFRIVLPVNMEISSQIDGLYAYVARRSATELLVTADPACFNPAQPLYSYADSELYSSSTGELFDITEYVADFETQKEEVKPRMFTKAKNAAERKRKVDKIMANVNSEFDYALNAPMGMGSYMLAKLSLDCRDYEFTKSEYLTVINYVNSVWQSPMNEARLNQTLINVYLPQMID